MSHTKENSNSKQIYRQKQVDGKEEVREINRDRYSGRQSDRDFARTNERKKNQDKLTRRSFEKMKDNTDAGNKKWSILEY